MFKAQNRSFFMEKVDHNFCELYRIIERCANRQTNIRPERQTDRYTSLETDRQTYVLRDRQTDIRP